MSATASAPPDSRRVLVVTSGLLLVMLLASLDQTIVSTALPTIVGDLGGLEHISWVVTAYLLAITAVTPLYGKLGDLYGRKVVLQGALVLFLIGSALCGLAQGMTELIVFRAIQGLGGGGLMVSAQAAIGDVVAPSQRGRYSGLFGAVFGVSSVAGPLIGGFLTTHVSWRAIFYVNLPLGALALVVLAITLPSVAERRKHEIDYAGTALLALGLSALILATTLGGNTFAWASPEIVAMGLVCVVSLIALGYVEQRAAEPILPPSLFRNRVFVVCAAVSLVVGFALFGSLTYLPLFQQVVRGLSPTDSGLQLIPVMGGLLISSIVSGQVISRTGRYKAWPIAGTAVAALGLWLLSSLDETTASGVAALHMLILGLGLGMVMQVLVLAVQNSVSYEQLGVATSGATLFRSIGGSLGTAVLGAIFTGRLSSELADKLPPSAGGVGEGGVNPAQIDRLPAPIHDAYISSFTNALHVVFLVAACVVLVAFVLSWLIEERPLRATVETASGVGEVIGGPVDTDSLREVTRGLTRLVGRERTLAFIADATHRAGVDLEPGPAWLLLYAGAPDAPQELREIRDRPHVDATRFDAALATLRAQGAVGDDDHVTPAGLALRDQLVAARTDCLRKLIAEWQPDEHPELDPLLARLAEELGEQPHDDGPALAQSTTASRDA
jgi:EmrB/QacA subfamily drug resistance transporter